MEVGTVSDDSSITIRPAMAAVAGAERRVPIAEAPKLGFRLGVRLGRP
jgi:hypothetical protein